MPTFSARGAVATNRHSVQAAVFLAGMAFSLCLLAGCVVDATLNADGSGTISYVYEVRPDATVEIEKPRFSSAHVTVQSLTIGSDRRATLKAAFDDATKLDTAAGFKTVAVTRKREGDNEEFQIVISNPYGANPDVKDQGLEGPQIAINLPGKVVDATPKADIDGNRVAWKIKFVDFMRSPKTTLTVRYAAGGAAAAPKDQAGSKKSD
jgi:hypothetical protein